MRVARRVALGMMLALACAPAGCGSSDETDDDELSSALDESDPVRARLAEVFLVETPTVDIPARLRQTPPGGIVFWNMSRVGARQVRESVRAYSRALEAAGKPPVLFSTDYEGGGLQQTASFARIAGIQRFTEGFTLLAHPRWIGVAYEKDPALGLELAALHGRIIARELRSVGLNYPLATVSDLAQNLFLNRGVSKNERSAAELMKRVYAGSLEEPGVVFVTKHFPGLGQTRGDTHDDTIVSSATREESERHLIPFAELIASANGSQPLRLSVMCGHAVYPVYDAQNNTTVSEAIASGLLRDRLGFRGLTTSDAMWMGPYGRMSGAPLMRVYMHSFIAGMDLLMIPGAKYQEALRYFQAAYDGTLGDAETRALAAELGLDGPAAIGQRLRERLAATQRRMNETRAAIGYAHAHMDPDGDARSRTAELRERYGAILEAVDPRWRGVPR